MTAGNQTRSRLAEWTKVTQAVLRYIPAFAHLKSWLDRHGGEEAPVISCLYDDVLDVLKAVLTGVPVDEEWYRREYPAVAKAISHWGENPGRQHFPKHGYFEGLSPFYEKWRDLPVPPPFEAVAARLSITPKHGRLFASFRRDYLLDLISVILRSVPVEADWYFQTYPDAKAAVEAGEYQSASDHYSRSGYFLSYLHKSVTVDSEGYLNRYKQARNSINLGSSISAQDHFDRIGYLEGCRPVGPWP